MFPGDANAALCSDQTWIRLHIVSVPSKQRQGILERDYNLKKATELYILNRNCEKTSYQLLYKALKLYLLKMCKSY